MININYGIGDQTGNDNCYLVNQGKNIITGKPFITFIPYNEKELREDIVKFGKYENEIGVWKQKKIKYGKAIILTPGSKEVITYDLDR